MSESIRRHVTSFQVARLPYGSHCVVMWKYLSRPPGCSSKAVQVVEAVEAVEVVAHHALLASESAHPLDVDVADDADCECN